MPAEHQHYVPQLLLRGFLSRNAQQAAKDQVHVLDLKSGRTFTPSIAGIMGERRFNDFRLDEGTLATIEPAAGRIESHIAPLVERIRSRRRLDRTPEEAADLALLMAFQFIRTKKIRLLPERLDKQIREKIARMGGDPTNIEGLPPVMDEEALKFQHVSHQISSLKHYTDLLSEKEFFLMVAPEGCSFYISDHPVVMHNDHNTGFFGGLGLAVHFIQIYLPLSAEVMLCAYDKAVLGRFMQDRDEALREAQAAALHKLVKGQITGSQMKEVLQAAEAVDAVTPLMEGIRAGEPFLLGPEQVRFYNSLQATQSHRFVIDPDGKFRVAREVVADRTADSPD